MNVLQRQTLRPVLAKRLLGVADSACEMLWPQWHRWFRDARTRLRASRDVADALESPNLLAITALTSLIWQQAVEAPARREGVAAGAQILAQGAQVSLPRLSAVFGRPMDFVRGTADVEQWLAQYMGTQVRDITATTVRTVQQVVRAGTEAGASRVVRAQALRDSFGLTPRQAQTLTVVEGRMALQGKHVRQMAQQRSQTSTQALRARAQQIALTQAVTLVNAGLYFAIRQAAQGGPISASAVRRYWTAAEGACPLCAAIPALNPAGVGVDEPFQTAVGPVLFPSVHPGCRCSADADTILSPAS